MSSTLVLLALLISLSIAVVFPELQFSRNSKVKISSEYEIMVNKQRKGFSVLGLLALVSFFIALQALSVPIFIFHLITDVIFALYAYLSFQVRSSAIQNANISIVNKFNNPEENNIELLKQAV
ncbi:MAG: hypothetical protein O3A48_02965 [Actinomycetota bacterium]|nr:hypothetical protein [Actinomycetota bacterium]MDA3013480.1 hypothetical protein [Actinomycetota bacterium]